MTLKELSHLRHQYDCSKTAMRLDYVPMTKYSDTTANGLTKAIIDFLTLSGHQAERISTTGRYIDNSKIVTDVIGRQRKIGTGKWIKGSGTKGSADISSTIGVNLNGKLIGISVKWEVKMKDKQSEDQKKYESDIKKSGGLYFLVHNFKEFYEYYLGVVNNTLTIQN